MLRTLVLIALLSISISAQQGVLGILSGRVTDQNGTGIYNVQVYIASPGSCFDEVPLKYTHTNPFGYYWMMAHLDCQIVVFLDPKDDRTFTPDSYFITFGSPSFENIDFVKNED